MNKPINIMLVYRSGGSFTLLDVELITRKIRKNLNRQNVVVYCITDLVKKYTEIEFGCILLPIPPGRDYPGWWSKMNLFSPETARFRPFFYLDLDTAIVSNLDSLLHQLSTTYERQFIMLEDFYRKRHPASGVMWIPKDHARVDIVWTEWMKAKVHKKRGDQEFIKSVTYPDMYFQNQFPEEIVSFKPNRKLLQVLNKKTSIVCFHGIPKIPEAAKQVKWVEDYIG